MRWEAFASAVVWQLTILFGIALFAYRLKSRLVFTIAADGILPGSVMPLQLMTLLRQSNEYDIVDPR